MIIVGGATVIGLIGVMLVCYRMAEWHQQESDYWSHVALLVRFDVREDLIYRPILEWAKAEHPSLVTRLHGWEPPSVRMARGTRVQS